MEQFPPVETFLYRTMLPSVVPFEDFWGRKRKYFYGRSRKGFPENREAYFGESHGNSFIVRNGPAFGTASKLAEEANSKSNHDYFNTAKMQYTENFEGEKQWDDFLYNCIGTISFLSPKNPNPDQSKVVRPKVESPEIRRQKLKWRQKKQNEKEKQEKSWETVQEQPAASFIRGSFPKIRLRTNNQEESKSFDEDKEFDDQYLATYFDARELLEDVDDISLMKVASDSDENSHKGRRNSRGSKKLKNKEAHKGNKKNSNGYHNKLIKSFENVKDNEQSSSKFQNVEKQSPFQENNLLLCDNNEKRWSNPPLSKNANLFHKKQNKIFDKIEDNEQSSSKFHTKKKSVPLSENVPLQCDDNEMAWTNLPLSKKSNVYNKTQNKIYNKIKDNGQSSAKIKNVKNKFEPFSDNILPCDDNEKAWTNPPLSKNSTMYHKKQNKIFDKVKDIEQISNKFQTGQKISETWPENVLLQHGDNEKTWTSPPLSKNSTMYHKKQNKIFDKVKDNEQFSNKKISETWSENVLLQFGDNEKAWPNPPLNRRGVLSAKIRCATLIKESSNNSKEDCASRRAARSGRSWGAFSCTGDIDYQFPNSATRTINRPEENLGLSTLHVKEKLPYIVKSAANWDNNEETLNLTGTKTITLTPNKETVTTGSTHICTSKDNLENGSKYEEFPKKDGDTSPKSISETEPKENFKLSNIIGKISRRYIRGKRIWNGWCYTEDESSYRPFIQKLLSKSARRNEKQNDEKSSDSDENFNKPKLEDTTVDDNTETAVAKINLVEEKVATGDELIPKINLVEEENQDTSTVIAKIHLVKEEDSTVDEDVPLVIAKIQLVEESDITVDEDLSTVNAKINLAEDPQRRTVEEKAITSSVSCTILQQGKNTSPKKTVRFDTNANKIHEGTYNKVVEEPPMRKPVYSRGQIRGRRVLDCKPLI